MLKFHKVKGYGNIMVEFNMAINLFKDDLKTMKSLNSRMSVLHPSKEVKIGGIEPSIMMQTV